jgi:hypothetical protein
MNENGNLTLKTKCLSCGLEDGPCLVEKLLPPFASRKIARIFTLALVTLTFRVASFTLLVDRNCAGSACQCGADLVACRDRGRKAAGNVC